MDDDDDDDDDFENDGGGRGGGRGGVEMGGENFEAVPTDEEGVDAKLRSILGNDKIHYSSLIDQVRFGAGGGGKKVVDLMNQ